MLAFDWELKGWVKLHHMDIKGERKWKKDSEAKKSINQAGKGGDTSEYSGRRQSQTKPKLSSNYRGHHKSLAQESGLHPTGKEKSPNERSPPCFLSTYFS